MNHDIRWPEARAVAVNVTTPFNIRMGPPGEFIRFGKTDEDSD
jgi:hypothetical protein